MSSTTLRYHSLTLAFLPARRERQFAGALKTIRIRTSRRQVKRLLRSLITRS